MDRVAKRDWQIRLAALVIFVLGVAAGALALNVYRDARGRSDRGPSVRVTDRLGLTDDQKAQVKAIFAESRAQMGEVRKECGPKFREVRERTDARLREVLTPEQWDEFQRLTREAREHRGHDRDGDGRREGQ